MEKEALINIIVNDLKEIQQLVETFKGKQAINSAFIRLAKTKLKNVDEELFLLNQLSDEASEQRWESFASPEVPEEQPANAVLPATDRGDQHIAVEPVKPTVAEKADEKVVVVEKKDEKVVVAVKSDEKAVESHVHDSVAELVDGAVKESDREVISQKTQVANASETRPVKGPKEQAILGDVLNKESQSINEQIQQRQEGSGQTVKQFGKPVDDVRKALGVNDRFYYQRELFEGNAELFNQTLNQINQMSRFEDASQFLSSNFAWNLEEEVAGSFLKIIKRRFL